jgi:hypothetical protein
MTTEISCQCGAVKVRIKGGPYVAVAIYPKDAVTVQGELKTLTIRTTPRKWCVRCGTRVIGEVVDFDQRGVNAFLLPQHAFTRLAHQLPLCGAAGQGRSAALQGFPAKFGGSDETVDW